MWNNYNFFTSYEIIVLVFDTVVRWNKLYGLNIKISMEINRYDGCFVLVWDALAVCMHCPSIGNQTQNLWSTVQMPNF